MQKGCHRLLSIERVLFCLYLLGCTKDNEKTLLRVTELGATHRHAHSSQNINRNFLTILGGGLYACGHQQGKEDRILSEFYFVLPVFNCSTWLLVFNVGVGRSNGKRQRICSCL